MGARGRMRRTSARRKVSTRLLDLAGLFRPWFLLPSMFSLAAGVLLALRNPAASVSIAQLMAGLTVAGPLIAGSCIIFNQVIDFARDSKSPRKARLPLVRLRFNIRTAYILSFALLGGGLALSYTIGPLFLIGAILASVLGFAYSHPATRVKERPPLDCILNGICFGIIPVALGWLLVTDPSWPVLMMGLPLLVIYSSGHMLLGLPDAPIDASAGIQTLPVILGHRRTVLASIGLVGAAGLVTCMLVWPGWYPSASLVVLPILVSIAAVHWRLLNEDRIEAAFLQLRYLYLVLGVIFLVSLTM